MANHEDAAKIGHNFPLIRGQGLPSNRYQSSPIVPPLSLDATSKRLIELLQEDGRASYAALAKVVGLSEAAVRQRVQRLIDSGVMQIVAVTDPTRVGFMRQAMVGLKVTGNLSSVAQQCARLPEVDYVVITAGRYDLLLEVVCEDDEHLLELMSDRIRILEGVVSAEVNVYLRLEKQTYSWGTR
ncbi:regulatory protein AsnC [Ferrimicrobium acidiphilum DSM 19497]|uniref:Regulatory protein AsnC n=1 Tax=Ferrimicrobium acidiphilum DSM 19497 TaxID=1121877 RepID=A0A0D8FZ08_9ACTN|nr:Lrp/AsnC family transcriptional regulator [Ferrimicrobium acidiphilum]KJE78197.1 regulatory protein AsnC [Ferrimicrobium acidiphilum DSM 19497]